jgi:hypothetical protein
MSKNEQKMRNKGGERDIFYIYYTVYINIKPKSLLIKSFEFIIYTIIIKYNIKK